MTISKTDSQKYQKITQREHILLRPDSYVGDIEQNVQDMWVYNEKSNLMIKQITKFVPGLYKIYDEVITNASDHSTNDKTCSEIKITVDKEEGSISVYNNGNNGIPIVIHSEHDIYIPEMIFAHLLTSSNYDDAAKRVTGGRNGYGAKLANIFSTKFIIEVGDKKNKKEYYQECTENMNNISTPKINTKYIGNSYVKITFYPDLKKFHLKTIDKHHTSLFYKRAWDIAATTNKTVKIYFNDKKLEINDFKEYIEMFYKHITVNNKIYDYDERWQVCCMFVPQGGSEVISYVNSICTYNGGTHTNYIIDNIVNRLTKDFIKKKDKNIKISPSLIKENLVFIINSKIENPAFSNQVKDILTTKSDKFGSKFAVTEAFMKKLAKTDLIANVLEYAKFKENSALKKTDGKKATNIVGIPKLEDATAAGGKSSYLCTLILTEGDSAKTFAMSGYSIVGNKYYGVFPLKGKLLNTRDASTDQIQKNEEIINLKKIIGLQQNKDYSIEENYNSLRYGRILILTDQDTDGSHIKGLVMNFIGDTWPELVKNNKFVASIATPIVKSTKGKVVKSFYTLTEYDKWKETNTKGWTSKYYKGLGTSSSREAKEYFKDIDTKIIQYIWNNKEKEKMITYSNSESDQENDSDKDSESDSEKPENPIKPTIVKGKIGITKQIYFDNEDLDSLSLAFCKKRSNDRKEWLKGYDKNNIILNDDKKVSYTSFINKDLIHHAMYDNHRSIASMVDGLKPSTRKIIYSAIKRKLYNEEVKVAQLAGYVSENAAYHHGEASLNGAIIGLAQNYVGSNNINMLNPNGQFGSRLLGGKDAASPRYIFTNLNILTQFIFRKEDTCLLNYLLDDGKSIEPDHYYPIVPTVLINGSSGIGTGYSSDVFPHNPVDIIKNLQLLLKNKKMNNISPWWARFKGTVERKDTNEYIIKGVYVIDGCNLIITELPIETWTSNYKKELEDIIIKDKNSRKLQLLSFKSNNDDKKVEFILTFSEKLSYYNIDEIEKKLKLNKTWKISNMHLYDVNGNIKKYKNILDIIQEFYDIRLPKYNIRKEFMLVKLKYEADVIKYKVKFIKYIIKGKIIVNNQPKSKIIDKLIEFEFPKLANTYESSNNEGYDYLIGMPIYNLTKEKIEELEKQNEHTKEIYDTLYNKTPSELWLEELEELLDEYIKWYTLQLEIDNDDDQPKKKKK
jgi:DNA topoisomerase-2